MDTAKLNNRIVIFRKEKQQLADNTEEWGLVQIAELWANSKYQSGKEIIANGIISTNTVLFTIRFSKTEIKANDLILFNGKYFNIISVLPNLTNKKYIEIIAECGIVNKNNLMG